MAPAMPNLTGQEDVYSVHTTEHPPVAELQQVQLVIMLERFPGALARAYALLCLFEVIPVSTRTELRGEDAIHLEWQFSHLPPDRLDLLQRKLLQLTECLGVWVSEAGSCSFNTCQAAAHSEAVLARAAG